MRSNRNNYLQNFIGNYWFCEKKNQIQDYKFSSIHKYSITEQNIKSNEQAKQSW